MIIAFLNLVLDFLMLWCVWTTTPPYLQSLRWLQFKLNPLGPIADTYIHHETFSFMMSLLAMSFGDRFCFSRMGRIGGGGRVHPKDANNMAAFGLSCRSDLVGTGRAISVLFGINGVRSK